MPIAELSAASHRVSPGHETLRAGFLWQSQARSARPHRRSVRTGPAYGNDGHRGGTRDRRHDRHRSVHEPRLPGARHPIGVLGADAVGRRRHRGAVRRALLCGARCRASALGRANTTFCRASTDAGVGFVAGWISATVGFAAPVALAAMAFGDYFDGVVPGRAGAVSSVLSRRHRLACRSRAPERGKARQHVSQRLDRAEARADRRADLRRARRSARRSRSRLRRRRPTSHYMTGAPFAVGLVFVMYAYSGWNAATYIAGEIHDPQRSLPLRHLGDADRDPALRRPQRRVPLHDADRPDGGQGRRRARSPASTSSATPAAASSAR